MLTPLLLVSHSPVLGGYPPKGAIESRNEWVHRVKGGVAFSVRRKRNISSQGFAQ